jgi:hypothetical protein
MPDIPCWEVRTMFYKSNVLVGVIAAWTIVVCFSVQALAQNDASKAKMLHKYLSDNFGVLGYKKTWYDNIKGGIVQGNTVIAETNLTGVNAKASSICSGVSGYVLSNENSGLGLQNVEVRGPKGAVLIKKTGLRGKCS